MVSVLMISFLLLAVPVLAGMAAAPVLYKKPGGRGTRPGGKGSMSLPFLWVSGQILLWAVFQVVCVPLVLLERNFSQVVTLFSWASGALCAVGIAVAVWNIRRSRKVKNGQNSDFRVLSPQINKSGRFVFCLWALFWALLIFQLVQAVRLAYADGDDAFYVAVSSITENSDTMYLKLPYTGGTTGLDTRHGLAPFPVWIAYLARVSGMRPVSAAQVAVPLVLIPMTYAVYCLIGGKICGRKQKERLPLFLVFSELLVLFGDYSFLTAENFMIARSRQGKAALGNIIIPVLILLLLVLLERIQEGQKAGWRFWILLSAAVTAGCLCSTLGALLACLLIGVTGCTAAVCWRRWKILVPLMLSCLPAVLFAALYLLLD